MRTSGERTQERELVSLKRNSKRRDNLFGFGYQFFRSVVARGFRDESNDWLGIASSQE